MSIFDALGSGPGGTELRTEVAAKVSALLKEFVDMCMTRDVPRVRVHTRKISDFEINSYRAIMRIPVSDEGWPVDALVSPIVVTHDGAAIIVRHRYLSAGRKLSGNYYWREPSQLRADWWTVGGAATAADDPVQAVADGVAFPAVTTWSGPPTLMRSRRKRTTVPLNEVLAAQVRKTPPPTSQLHDVDGRLYDSL